MAELTTLARPYAKAAFESARETNGLDAWSTMLQWLAAITSDGQVASALDKPGLTTAQKAQVVIDLCEGKLDAAAKNFVTVVAENKRLALLPQIALQFEQLKAEHEKTLDVEAVSAVALSAQQSTDLSETLRKRFARAVALHLSVDENLLGGMIIRAGDTVIDGSVRGKLARLADAMNS